MNESKVFQESGMSPLTKSSDKQQIIAEAKRRIDHVVSELDNKGPQGWSTLAANFKSIWKATVGGVATIYDMGRETYHTGQTPVRLWDNTKSDQYNASPFHDPTNGIGCGGGDAIVAKVMEVPQLVSFGYDVATDERVRTKLINTVSEVSWPKIQNAAADFFIEKKNKYIGGGNVMMHEASLDVSSILLEVLGGAKILDILEEMLRKLGKEARQAVIKAIKEKLTDPDQIAKFIRDIDASDELLQAIASRTDLIDAWKRLDDAGLIALRKSPIQLQKFDGIVKNNNLGLDANALGELLKSPQTKGLTWENPDKVLDAVKRSSEANIPGLTISHKKFPAPSGATDNFVLRNAKQYQAEASGDAALSFNKGGVSFDDVAADGKLVDRKFGHGASIFDKVEDDLLIIYEIKNQDCTNPL